MKRQKLSKNNEISVHVPQQTVIPEETKVMMKKDKSFLSSAIQDVERHNSAIVTLATEDDKLDNSKQLSIEDLTWTPALLRRKFGQIEVDHRQPKQTGF